MKTEDLIKGMQAAIAEVGRHQVTSVDFLARRAKFIAHLEGTATACEIDRGAIWKETCQTGDNTYGAYEVTYERANVTYVIGMQSRDGTVVVAAAVDGKLAYNQFPNQLYDAKVRPATKQEVGRFQAKTLG